MDLKLNQRIKTPCEESIEDKNYKDFKKCVKELQDMNDQYNLFKKTNKTKKSKTEKFNDFYTNQLTEKLKKNVINVRRNSKNAEKNLIKNYPQLNDLKNDILPSYQLKEFIEVKNKNLRVSEEKFIFFILKEK
jgi:transketolase